MPNPSGSRQSRPTVSDRRFQRDPGRPCFVISVAASLVQAHPRTLRIYEDEGLLAPARTPTNIRLYSENDIRRILWIRRLTQERGVNLAGVKLLFELEERLGHPAPGSALRRRQGPRGRGCRGGTSSSRDRNRRQHERASRRGGPGGRHRRSQFKRQWQRRRQRIVPRSVRRPGSQVGPADSTTDHTYSGHPRDHAPRRSQ